MGTKLPKCGFQIKGKKEKIKFEGGIANFTLLGRRRESVVHFSPDCDQLDDLVILPVTTTIDNVNLVLHVVQLNDFQFFSGNSSFLGWFGMLCNTFRRIALVKACVRSMGAHGPPWVAGENPIPGREGIRIAERETTYERLDVENLEKMEEAECYSPADEIRTPWHEHCQRVCRSRPHQRQVVEAHVDP